MKYKGEICNLSDLKIGQSGRVVKIDIENRQIKKHLLDMGIVRGVEVTIKKIAPMGDPIDISLRDYELCICRNDLSKIKVEVLS